MNTSSYATVVHGRPMDLAAPSPWLASDAVVSCGMALVVEDDAAERCRLALLLEKLGLEVIEAADGQAALAALQSDRLPGLVISDWQMPGMNGVDLCRAMRRDRRLDAVYFMLVTGQDQAPGLVAGLNAGADEFLRKPYSGAELHARLNAAMRIVKLQENLQASNRALKRTLQKNAESEQALRNGLRAASLLQQRLLPPAHGFVNGYEFGRLFQPAEELAGDLCGCIALNERHIAFYLLDVVGHGIGAALNSFAIGRLLSPRSATTDFLYEAGAPRAPADVVGLLNRRFAEDTDCDQYFTIVYGVLDTETGKGSFCQAGHPNPLILRASGKLAILGSGGLPAGLAADAQYEDVRFALDPGDQLLLVSDGVLQQFPVVKTADAISRLGSDLIAGGVQRSLKDTLSVCATTLIHEPLDGTVQDDASVLVISRPDPEAAR